MKMMKSNIDFKESINMIIFHLQECMTCVHTFTLEKLLMYQYVPLILQIYAKIREYMFLKE